jgi:hypothetical protein
MLENGHANLEKDLTVIRIPIFRALTVETDLYPAGQLIEGDFIHTPAYTNEHGLKFAAGYEIWMRDPEAQDLSFFAIDPQTLEISFDNGQTYTEIGKK